MDLAPDDLIRSVAHHRDRQFADLLVLAIGLAAETHPEVLREALGKVFDLRQWVQVCRSIDARVAATQRDASRAREDVEHVLGVELERVRRELNALRYELEQLRTHARPALRVVPG